MADSISERLDAVLADLPENAWSITHVEGTDSLYQVCTVTIDWRLVPGEEGPKLQKVGRLSVVRGTDG